MYLLNRVLFSLVFLIFNLALYAQDLPIDSLKARLKSVRRSERATTLQQLARELKYEDPQLAMQYAEKALKVLDSFPDQRLKAKTLGRKARIHQITGSYDSALHYANLFHDTSRAAKDTFLIANAHNYIGITHRNLGNYPEALTHIRRYIQFSQQLDRKHHMGMGYNNLGNTYLHLGDYDRALENYMEFLRISEKLHLKKDGVPAALSNIALIYREIDSLEKALQHLFRAAEVSKEVNDRVSLSNIYSNIGTVYEKQESVDSARLYYQKAMYLSRQLNRQNEIASNFLNLANLENQKGNCSRALQMYRHALDIYSRINNRDGQAHSLYRIGRCYRMIDEMEPAGKFLQKAKNQAQRLGDKAILRDCYYELYKMYEEKGQPGQALASYKSYDRYADSIFSRKSADNIARWQIRYRTDKKEQRITLLETQRKLQDARIKRQNLMLWLLIVGAVFTLGFSFIIYRLYRIKRRTNHQLAEQNREIAAQSNELAKANEELKKLSIVASETDNLIFLADARGSIEWVNQAVSRLYGKKPEDFTGKDLFSLSSCESRDELATNFYEKKRSINYESSLKGMNGELYSFQTTLTPIIDQKGNIERIIAVDSDITRIKEVEQDLIQKQKELEQANATKDKFFSIISHDLKNPFNSLLGLSDLLVRKADRMDPDKIRTFHQSIYTTTRQAYELLSNLLQWSRSQLQQISINSREFEMSELVDENLSLHQQRAKEKGIELVNHIRDSIPVFADYDMITSVVRNLLSNAIKFTGNGGSVEIDVRDQGRFWEFQVRDTGMGLSKEQINQMFQPGKAHSAEGTDKEKGTGLGLLLCKEFVTKNGGAIQAYSRHGSGSTFSFTLPKASS